MTWLLYPVRLLMYQMGIKGVTATLLLITTVTLFQNYALPDLPIWPLPLLAGYLGAASLWLVGREIHRLQTRCAQQLESTSPALPTDSSWLLMQPLVRDMQTLLNGVLRRQQALQQRLDEISHSSQELEQSAVRVTRSAERQSDAAGTAAAAVEELNVAIDEVSRLADSSRHSSVDASEKLEASIQRLQQLVSRISVMAGQATDTNALMGELNIKSQAINDMSAVIQGIADQTNLLSLNAAIEAARAGESGRGFAVVADEVRRLARHSQESAAGISRTIEAVQHQIQQATQQMSGLSGMANQSVESSELVKNLLDQVHRETRELTRQVVQVAVSTEQQSQAVKEIATLADQVSQGNAENLHAADQARTIAHHLAHLTE